MFYIILEEITFRYSWNDYNYKTAYLKLIPGTSAQCSVLRDTNMKTDQEMFRELLINEDSMLSSVIGKSNSNQNPKLTKSFGYENKSNLLVSEDQVDEQVLKVFNAGRGVVTIGCGLCELTFDTLGDMKQHEKTHMIACKACYTVFTREVDLKKHMQNFHKTVPDFVARNMSVMWQARDGILPEATNVTLVTCEVCFVVFTRHRDLKKHMTEMHLPKLYSAPVSVPVSAPRAVQVRKQSVTRNDPAIKKALQQMVVRHDGLWYCTVPNCGRSVKDKGHALDHCESHLDGLCYPCPNYDCDKWFSTWASLRGHKKPCKFKYKKLI